MAFQGQNAVGAREHSIRTLQFEYGGRGNRGRQSDINVIGVMERRADLTKPLMGFIKNTGDSPLVLYAEQSDDAASAIGSTYAHARGVLEITAAVDGNTFALGEGTNTVTFEFDDNGVVGGGNVPVPLNPNASRPLLDALVSLVTAVRAQAALGNIGIYAEDITEYGSYGATVQPTPTALFTHTVKGAASAVTGVLVGMTGTYTATAAPAANLLTLRSWPAAGAAVTGTTITVPAKASVQFLIETATLKWVRFSLEPDGFSLTLPGGTRTPEAHMEIGYYFGIMERYERSNGFHQPMLPN